MHDEKKKPELSEICQIEKDLISALRTVVSHGIFSKDVDTKELGELVDMVKDLAETKRNCWEACYYETVTEAMKEYDMEDMMGYNPNRYSSGRYAPSGVGNRTSGYNMFPPYVHMDPMMRNRDVFHDDGMMGYSKNGNGRNGSDSNMNGERGNDYYGYPNDRMGNRYGRAYNEYEDARRHYTETKSLEDKNHMDEKAMEHVSQSMMTLRDIWKNADPMLKKEVSNSIATLASEFKSA